MINTTNTVVARRRPGDPVRRGFSVLVLPSLEYWVARSAPGDDSGFGARDARHSQSQKSYAYAFAEGRSPTRANHAAMLALVVSSGWPTWLPKLSQP